MDPCGSMCFVLENIQDELFPLSEMPEELMPLAAEEEEAAS